MTARTSGAEAPRRLNIDGVSLAVHEWPGGGPAIVTIHGLTSNHTAGYPIADVLGGSDLLGLPDHFGLDRAVIMGHSLGAHIGVRFASHHPDRVAKLVLFDGGLDVRAEVFDSIAPAVNRLGVEFASVEMFLAIVKGLPMFEGRTRLWAWHHRIAAPTLLLRAPDGLLTPDDCLMTQEEAEAMAHAIPDCRLVVVPGVNHYTILLGDDPLVRRELSAFLAR
ncbi:MAG: hypothetical protein DMD95_19510 [Candidatus Rokuibacteriota bacterium]|nr:MAG: hypothetical protein DMD95_19510 [Candidatus Rokubacteria bacterium]